MRPIKQANGDFMKVPPTLALILVITALAFGQEFSSSWTKPTPTPLTDSKVPGISYIISAENSGAVRQQMGKMIEMGKAMVSQNCPEDEAAVIRFVGRDKIDITQQFTANKTDLNDALDNLYIEGGQPALIDAIYLSIENLTHLKTSNRKGVVLMTNGQDSNSYYNEKQLINLARETKVPIYAIAFIDDLSKDGGFTTKSPQSKAKAFLERLTKETGGKVFFPNSAAEVAAIGKEILSLLHGGTSSPCETEVLKRPPQDVVKAENAANKVLLDSGSLFNEGLLLYADNKLSDAGERFNNSVKVFLLSNLNIQRQPSLSACYDGLIENIYRIQFPSADKLPQVRSLTLKCNWNNIDKSLRIDDALADRIDSLVKESIAKRSPLDELSSIELTPDEYHIPSEVRVIRAKAGDTVAKVAERAGAGPAEVAKINRLLPDSVLGAGREIKIPSKPTPAPVVLTPEKQKISANDPRANPDYAKYAKTCDLCVSQEYDKVSGDTSFFGRTIKVTANRKSGFLINTWKFADGSMSLHFRLFVASPCIDADATIQFLFRDGSRLMTNSHESVFNCDGEAVIYFRRVFDNEDNLRTLQTKPIETLRVFTYKSSLQEDFTVAQSTELMNQLNCLDRIANNVKSTPISLDQARPSAAKPDSPPLVTPKPAAMTVSEGVTQEMKIISQPRASYTDSARVADTRGTVVLSVTFLASGQVGSISVVKGLPNGLTEQAIAAARRIVFEPAKMNGMAHSVTKQMEYPFLIFSFSETEVPEAGSPPRQKPEVVSGEVLNERAISLPKPGYPPAAKAVRAGGSVSVQVLIDEEGRVVSASAVSGHPLLQQAAVAAARGARFSPRFVDGQAVKASGIIIYTFVP